MMPSRTKLYREAGALGRYADVAEAGQVAARADGRPVDRRDQRNLQIVEGAGDALDAATVGGADGGRRPVAQAARLDHALDVAARAECRAGASEDGRAHLVVRVDARHGVHQPIDHVVVGDGVARLWPVQRQHDDVPLLSVEHRVGH